MIKFIRPEDTLSLRSLILREGLAPELCIFEGDDNEYSFHLGYFKDDLLISIASFHKQDRADFGNSGFQLRGMATLTDWQGKGIGNQLLNFAIVYLRGQMAGYLWCNARQLAFRFYTGLGFEFISEEFLIEGIGLHRTMYVKIQ